MKGLEIGTVLATGAGGGSLLAVTVVSALVTALAAGAVYYYGWRTPPEPSFEGVSLDLAGADQRPGERSDADKQRHHRLLVRQGDPRGPLLGDGDHRGDPERCPPRQGPAQHARHRSGRQPSKEDATGHEERHGDGQRKQDAEHDPGGTGLHRGGSGLDHDLATAECEQHGCGRRVGGGRPAVLEAVPSEHAASVPHEGAIIVPLDYQI